MCITILPKTVIEAARGTSELAVLPDAAIEVQRVKRLLHGKYIDDCAMVILVHPTSCPIMDLLTV